MVRGVLASVGIAVFCLALAVLALAAPASAEPAARTAGPPSTSGLAVLAVLGMAGLAVMGARSGDDDPSS